MIGQTLRVENKNLSEKKAKRDGSLTHFALEMQNLYFSLSLTSLGSLFLVEMGKK